jgi:hypothetical protein
VASITLTSKIAAVTSTSISSQVATIVEGGIDSIGIIGVSSLERLIPVSIPGQGNIKSGSLL